MSKFDIDSTRNYLYSSDYNSIKLYRYNAEDSADDSINYLNQIPIVRTWDNSIVNPDNLLLYNGGSSMLMSDMGSYDSILNMNIEKGIVTSKQSVHKRVGDRHPENIGFKVRKFDYNYQGDLAQYDSGVVGINNNSIMRFDVISGDIAHIKTYERCSPFTAMSTDLNGNVIVGDQEGKIRLFPDVGKRAARCFQGLGEPITSVKCSPTNEVIATTDKYFLYFPSFDKSIDIFFIGKLPLQVIDYLDISKEKMTDAQFSQDTESEKAITFSIGKYMFHWDISKLILKEQEFRVYDANNLIIHHKNIPKVQFVISETTPLCFNTR